MVAVNEPPPSETYVWDGHLRIPVDAEHSGIRIAGCAAFLGGSALIFFILSLLLNNGALAFVISPFVAAGLAWGLERMLRQRWPSGRVVTADENQIEIRQEKKNETERKIDPNQHVNVLSWYFEVQRRSARVQKGWYVIGLSLEQNGMYLPVYTFAPPDQFEKMLPADRFTRLEREKKSTEETTRSAAGMRRAGEQRRLLEAEKDRSMVGAEMTFPQFIAYVEFLQKNYPRWMITAS